MRLFTKEELIDKLRDIFSQGFHKSIRKAGNDGAVGNTLEFLLGINENNLPIPNAAEWELKGQRENTNSLITLKHIEPSPKAAKIVSSILLHKDLYLLSEFSFKKFLDSIRDGTVLIDFDARTGHNHGTKFRIRQNNWTKVYQIVDKII